MFFSKKDLDYSFLKVIGCKYFLYTRSYSQHKLSPRSSYCVFLGYSNTYKGYNTLISQLRSFISHGMLFFMNIHFLLEISPLFSQLSPSFPSYSSSLVILTSDINKSAVSTSTSLIFTSLSHTITPPQQTALFSPTPIPSSSSLPIIKVYTRRHTPQHKVTLPIKPSSVMHSTHVMQIHSKIKSLLTKLSALLATNHPVDVIELEPIILHTSIQTSTLENYYGH
jgi:hypothetical protein